MRSKYWEAIVQEMEKFAKDDRVLFIGQQCASEDFYNTLKTISTEKRYEMPVAEEMQMGICIGLAFEGFLPISIYQRMDFLPRAADQLVNHLSICKRMTQGMFNPKVIIRTTVGTNDPFDVGLQHNKDLSEGFQYLVDFPIIRVKTVQEVHEAYEVARMSDGPTMIVEYQELYNVQGN